MTKAPPPKKKLPKKKDYAYRSTWRHAFSRARNLARRGGLTRRAMLKQYGRFPRGAEWWGADGSFEAWEKRWVAEHPKPK